MKIIPRLLPDELLPGYRERISDWNGLRTAADLRYFLAPDADKKSDVASLLLTFAAKENALTVRELVHGHTCYGVTHSIGRYAGAAAEGRDLYILGNLATRVQYVGWRVCGECVKADLQQRRGSYWRRRHHLKGQFRCHEHGCVLLSVPKLTSHIRAPQDALPEAEPLCSPELHAQWLSNPHITKAVEILEQVMLRSLVLDRSRCQQAFRKQVKNRGEDPSAPGWFARFSAEMDAAFGLEWLASTFQRTTLRAGEVHTHAFPAFSGNSVLLSHATMATVASLLFPTAQAAIDSLTRQDP